MKPDTPILDTGNALSTGLILAWLFDEGTGTAINDYSGEGNHGEVLNATPTWETGDYGAELVLDGTNDRVRNVSDSLAALGTAARSVLLLFNNRTTSGVNVFGGIGNTGVKFGFYANGTALNFWNADAGGDTQMSASGWTTGYHTLVATKPSTASGGKAYFDNNTPIALNNYVGGTPAGFLVGVADPDAGQDWHPEIDIVAAMVWDRELSEAEVGELMTDPFVMFRNPVIGSTAPLPMFRPVINN